MVSVYVFQCLILYQVITRFITICYATGKLRNEFEGSYTAAVYEHVHRDPLGILGKDGVRKNLAAFEKAARIASKHGADIIVFPEYGIIPIRGKREKIAPFLEHVPDPEEESWNPCLQEDIFGNRTILTVLSCIAKTNNISVVANMGAQEPCLIEDCPDDKRYHLNTNVGFDRSGTLIARYYKQFLYLEDSYNAHPRSKTVTFETEVGRFGTFTCFDILFHSAVEMVEKKDINSAVFPTWWSDSHPFLSSIQFQEAWAVRHNVTLLAANIRMPLLGATGSGIYTGNGATVYTHSEDPASKLLISKIDEPQSARIVSENVTEQLLPFKYLYKQFNLENYTLSEIVNNSGLPVTACNRGLCCKLIYRSSSNISESYYLAAVNGTRTDSSNRYSWCEEACILIRCDNRSSKRCAKFPVKSATVFNEFHLSGNFTSEYVYPSVLVSDMKLLPTTFWSYAALLNESVVLRSLKPITVSVLSVSLYGRCYDRDP